jgi:predicted ribosome quality control (RQC) complex YloA/Tae2 family protein
MKSNLTIKEFKKICDMLEGSSKDDHELANGLLEVYYKTSNYYDLCSIFLIYYSDKIERNIKRDLDEYFDTNEYEYVAEKIEKILKKINSRRNKKIVYDYIQRFYVEYLEFINLKPFNIKLEIND